MTVDVECPHCLTTRTIVLKTGTNGSIENKRIRCSKKSGGCGKLFWSKNNTVIIVPQTRTKLKTNRLSDKSALIRRINNVMSKYKDVIPVEIFRSKLLELESIGEMRKK